MKTNGTRGRFAPVTDVSESPFCALRPVSVNAVALTDGFWAPRLALNREVTIPAQYRHCEATGRLDNFRRASGKLQGEFQGIFFNDSDVYKWAEAASWSLSTHPDPALEADLDAVIAEVAAAQGADGYLNTYFVLERAGERLSNLKDMHEIYCAGHLFQAAVAHHRATGKKTLLEVALRLADFLYERFGPGALVGACGHEEAEMGLVELYRTTRESRYLELARLMIEARGRVPGVLGGAAYHQDHAPFTRQTEMVGHAVRHMYLCCGAADVVAETGDGAYLAALDALWTNFTLKKMYVTGAAGSRWEGEAFGADYELPNERAYAETCAAIGSVMWNWRMLQVTGLAQYADVMELALYNAVLPGLSLDGGSYFYQNPLADRGGHRREKWFGCACCPPNVARLLASLPGYFYGASTEGAFVNLYGASTATVDLPGGGSFTLRQETGYPWSGEIVLHVDAAPEREAAIHLRMPFWADETDAQLYINGVEDTRSLAGDPGRFRAIRRRWAPGDQVRLVLPMPVELVESHPHVLNNRGRVALQRGPLVYCVEQADNPAVDPWDVVVAEGTEFRLVPMNIGGQEIVGLAGAAAALPSDTWEDSLYAPFWPEDPGTYKQAPITAIPYFAWANRESGPMIVWLAAAGTA